MSLSLEDIRVLRDKTGAGVMDCKNALNESKCDIDKAVEILRKRGIKVAEKKSSRDVKDGIVEVYIHAGSKLGVMVELSCETDFVAKNEEFKALAHDLAMQIAAKSPSHISREEISQNVIDKEKEILKAQFKDKPDNVVEKILNGKIEDFYKEKCLLDQTYVKEEGVIIKDLITDKIAKFGENIVVRRFVRFSVGE
ncbi:MAG: translation elongation factor Ts [Candidatus Kaelpia aquatica]|nr:translation elongation factor Ts [Candidatus Kaelpia aquatica]